MTIYASRKADPARISTDSVTAIHCSVFNELRSCLGTGFEGLRNGIGGDC
ncbi:MAG TPA: hypothetical protein VJ967_07900 [Clostridia bacterium]|nr:hypothetical protein [Clostridia bacterium]